MRIKVCVVLLYCIYLRSMPFQKLEELRKVKRSVIPNDNDGALNIRKMLRLTIIIGYFTKAEKYS